MLTIALMLAIFVMKLVPQSTIAVVLHRHLVERPVAWLAKVERRHVVFAIIVIATLVFAHDLLAVAGPADAAVAFLWDLSLYVDLTGAALAVAGVRWTKTLWTVARSRTIVWTSTSRTRPSRHPRRATPEPRAANDDDEHRAAA